MSTTNHHLLRWKRSLTAFVTGIFCLTFAAIVQAQAPGRANRSVFDTERGGYFTYPFGNQWSRYGAEFGRTNHSYGAMPADSVKGLHGRLQHFASLDEGSSGLAYFPWSEFVAYDANEVAQGRPSLIVTATYQGRKRPLYFGYDSFNAQYPFQAVNVRDDRFIKFWIKNYVRAIMSATYYQNWWIGADNGTFRRDLYGVLDDGGRFIKEVVWDSPYPQNDAEWVSANIYMLSKIKEWAPNIRVACNDVGLNEAQAYRHAEFMQQVDGVIREDTWYLAGGGSDWYRTAFYKSWSRTLYRASVGKVEILEIPMSSSDSTLLRRSWMAFLIFGGDNFFFGPKDSSSREIDPALWAEMRNRLGRPTGSSQSAQESGRSEGHRLYSRECEGGICYLNWTGSYKTAYLPSGRNYYDRYGNQIYSISLGDMEGDYVLFSPNARVSWPAINPRFGGPVSGAVTVKLDLDPCFGYADTIRYTTDGSEPSQYSSTYYGPFTLYSSATVRARAFKSGQADSFVNAATYNIVGTPTVEFQLTSDNGSEFLKNDFPLVKLNNPSTQTVSVNYSVSGGSATNGSDYNLSSGTLTFPPGEQYRFFRVPIVNDSNGEPNETIQISLSSPSNAYLGGKSTYTYTIIDNDGGGSTPPPPPPPPPTPTPDPTPSPTPGTTVNFSKLDGTYNGLIQPLSLSFAQTGNIVLTLGAGGSFTATVKIGDKSTALSGSFAADGSYQGSLSGTSFVLKVQLDPFNANGKFTGSVTESGSKIANVLANRRPIWTTSNPCPRAGRYTVVLPADSGHTESSYPQGAGFGLITVSTTGSVWVIGSLGDQTSISEGTNLSADGEAPFHTVLYGSRGAVTGWMYLRDSAASNQVAGTLNWFKPYTGATMYPGAFTGLTTLAGSIYVAPPTRPQILSSPGGYGSFTHQGGGIAPSNSTLYVTVSSSNVVRIVGSDPFTFTYDAANGFFSGTLYDFQRNSYSFRGAVLQKQNTGAGHFKGNNVTGPVTFKPAL